MSEVSRGMSGLGVTDAASDRIFDTGTVEGKIELTAEAILAVNSNKKLKEGLKVESLSTLIKGYQAHVRRYDGQILTTLQTSEEGQESIDLAGTAAKDMAERIKVFSGNAAELKAYVDDFRQETRPLELAQAHIKTCMVAAEKLAALAEAARELRGLQMTNEGKIEYYKHSASLIQAIGELWGAFSRQAKHPRLASIRQVIESAKATLSVNCRAEFKSAQQVLGRGLEVDKDVMHAASTAVDALGIEMLQEIIDGYCSWAAYNFYLPWAPNDAPPDAPWTCEEFKAALNKAGEFVEGKVGEINAVFPYDWGVARQLCRRVLREAQQTLKTRVNDMHATYVRANLTEITAMVRAAAEFERQVELLWSEPKRDFVSAQSCSIKGALSDTLSSFLKELDPSFGTQISAATKGDTDHLQATVFTLDDLDMDNVHSTQNPDGLVPTSAKFISGVHGELGDLNLEDLQPLAIECLFLCTVLNGGCTSFGQQDKDRDGLQAARVQAEMTTKSYKAMLYFLDTPSRVNAKDSAPPWSLEYRLLLLKVARASHFPTYKLLSRQVEFKAWRDAQLRLVVAMAKAALGVRETSDASLKKNKDSANAAKLQHDAKGLVQVLPRGAVAESGQGAWAVKDEAREYTSAQLLQSIRALAGAMHAMDAPTEELWERYCEPLYARMAKRLENQMGAVARKRPFVRWYGKVSLYLYEQVVGATCFDQHSGLAGVKADVVVGVLRTIREALDIGELAHACAFAVCAHRQYMRRPEVPLLEALSSELAKVFALARPQPSAAMLKEAANRMTLSAEYREEVLTEVASELEGMLCDTHGCFNNPEEEIDKVVDVFLESKRGLVAADAGDVAWNPQVRERLVANALKMSVRTRFQSMTAARVEAHAGTHHGQEGEADQEGQMSVEDCIDVVNELVDEVETEVLYFAPGFARHLKRATGVAVLEYARCCREAIEGVVGAFKTLSAEAVRLWRALSALQDKVNHVLTGETRTVEGTQAVELLQGLSKLFRRCVDAWLDEQTNRYAEVLDKVIQLEIDNHWVALPHSGVSASVVDLFQMFNESVPQLFRLGLPIEKDDTISIADKVDLFTMKYCNDVLTHHYGGRNFRMDSASLIPKFRDKRDMANKMSDKLEELFTAEGRQAARVRKEMERPAYTKTTPNKDNASLSKVKSFFNKVADPKSSDGAQGTSGLQQGPGTPGNENKSETSALEQLDKIGDKIEKKFEKMLGVTKAENEVVDAVECMLPKDARLADQSLPTLCIKLKNLQWAKKQTLSLEQDVNLLWKQELSRRKAMAPAQATSPEKEAERENDDESESGDDSLGPLFVNAQMSLQHGHESLIDYIAHKIVYFDLRDDFVARLYYPTPKVSSLAPLLKQDGVLDRVLTEVAGEFAIEEFSHMMWTLFEQVMVLILRAMEWCLIGPAMGAARREFAPADVPIIREDMVALQNYFIQRDEEGNASGLDENLVLERSKRMESIIKKLLSISTEKLIDMFYDRNTVEEDDTKTVTRTNIIGTLARRTEKEAKDLVKEQKNKKKQKT